MSYRFVVVWALLALSAMLPTSSAGQSKTSTPLKTPDGKPDLQGIWTNVTVTPLERPANPSTWAKPWKIEIPMQKTEGPIYEYACQEGNYAMEGMLAGARAEEKGAK